MSFIAGAIVGAGGTILATLAAVWVWLRSVQEWEYGQWRSQYEPPNQGTPE